MDHRQSDDAQKNTKIRNCEARRPRTRIPEHGPLNHPTEQECYKTDGGHKKAPHSARSHQKLACPTEWSDFWHVF